MKSSNNLLRIVSRKSNLAQIQVQEVMRLLPEVPYIPIWIDSFGDLHHEVSLLNSPPADIFTREIDQYLAEEKADIAIHSAKDLPFPLSIELTLIALLPATEQRDALVSGENQKLADLPRGARVGTSSPMRRNELLAQRSDLTIVSVRGTIEQRIAQVDNGQIDALIVAACALDRLQLSYRAAELLPFRTHPLQGHLAVVAKRGHQNVNELFAPLDERVKYGDVTLVGFGPGNPDLLTLGGFNAIERADVICYDDLTNETFLHRFDARKIYVGKRRNAHSMAQEDINRLMLDLAKSGNKVVRLKGGDPMIFAHGGEEVRYLQENYIKVLVIPGVSAGIAAASLTKTPLTFRGESASVAFVTGHHPSIRLPETDTVVVYMGATHIRELAKKAITDGRNPNTPVLLVHNVSLPGQKEYFTDLQSLSENETVYPTPLIMIVGTVANKNFHESKSAPQILVTGTTADAYWNEGNVFHQPLIEIKKIYPNPTASDAIDQLSSFDWLFFTSRYSVRFFFDLLCEKALDSRALSGLKIAAIGKSTAATLLNYGIHADLIPADESSEGLLKELKERNLHPAKVLLPRSHSGLSVLPDNLKRLGWQVKVVSLYKNEMPTGLQPVDLNPIHKIVFSSPSCVSHFLQLYGAFPAHKEFVFRGKETEKRFVELQKEWI